METLTRTGVRGLCTPGYAAPEQYGSGTDARTDIYALGATLYSVFTHTVPPTSVDLASGRVAMPPVRTVRPDLSEKTASIIEWMMKLSMDERPQTVKAVMEAFGFNPLASPLDNVPQTESRFWLGKSLTQISSASTGQRRRSRLWRWFLPATGGAAVVGVGILGWKAFGTAHPPHGRPPR